MKIRMSLDGDRFLASESILLKVALENTASSMVDVPDPEDLRNPQFSYTITGPAYPHGSAFKPRISLPDPNTPNILKMGPGEKLEGQLALNKMFTFTQPGKYTLAAHYSWGGQSENFGPLSFVIEKGALRSARVMADSGFQKPAMQRVLGLVGDPPRLYQFFFQEQRPATGEIELGEMIRAATPPPNSLQAIAPWTNFDRSEVFFARFGWQAPGAIGIESGPPEESVKVAVPGDPTVIAPALMTEEGGTTVFTYTPASLTMLSFPLPAEGAPPPAAKVQWSTPVAPPIRAAAAALGPPPHNLIFAITVSQTATGAELKLFEGNGNGGARTAEVKGARVLANSEPALWVDNRGAAHVAGLFAEDNLFRRVYLAELVWNGSDVSPKVDRQGAFQLPRPCRASTVAFSVTPARPPRLNWVILLEDGSVLTNLSPSAPYRTNRTPLLPLQLLGMSSATYLLVADPVNFLGFEMLH
jgi:hypothetical protein